MGVRDSSLSDRFGLTSTHNLLVRSPLASRGRPFLITLIVGTVPTARPPSNRTTRDCNARSCDIPLTGAG